MDSMGPFLAVANTLGKKKKDSWHADLHLMKSVQVRVSSPSNCFLAEGFGAIIFLAKDYRIFFIDQIFPLPKMHNFYDYM